MRLVNNEPGLGRSSSVGDSVVLYELRAIGHGNDDTMKKNKLSRVPLRRGRNTTVSWNTRGQVKSTTLKDGNDNELCPFCIGGKPPPFHRIAIVKRPASHDN